MNCFSHVSTNWLIIYFCSFKLWHSMLKISLFNVPDHHHHYHHRQLQRPNWTKTGANLMMKEDKSKKYLGKIFFIFSFILWLAEKNDLSFLLLTVNLNIHFYFIWPIKKQIKKSINFIRSWIYVVIKLF